MRLLRVTVEPHPIGLLTPHLAPLDFRGGIADHGSDHTLGDAVPAVVVAYGLSHLDALAFIEGLWRRWSVVPHNTASQAARLRIVQSQNLKTPTTIFAQCANRQDALMFFRLTTTVRDVSLHPDGETRLAYSNLGPRDLDVELGNNDDGNQVVCTVTGELDPPRKALAAFQRLADGHLPEGMEPDALSWLRDHGYIDDQDRINKRTAIPLHFAPNPLADFAAELWPDFMAMAHGAIGLLRWRSRTLGSTRPLSGTSFDWSLSGEDWLPMPGFPTGLRLDDVSRLEVTPGAAREIGDLLERDQREPVAHALLREAWNVRRQSPNSALLIGMTALEVGIKHYVAACVPQATWLVEKLQSPPMSRLMGEYVPQLTPPTGGEPVTFDEEVVRRIRKASDLRNELAHTGRETPLGELKPILLTIRDALWTFDAALGHQWAANYTLASLGDDEPDVGYRKV